ncbi:MAG: hypothetical protein ABW321_06220 [Polyangiales bacterium]
MNGRYGVGLWLLMLVAAAGCSVDAHRQYCRSTSDCRDGQECYEGFCIARDAGPVVGPDPRDGGALQPDATMSLPIEDSGTALGHGNSGGGNAGNAGNAGRSGGNSGSGGPQRPDEPTPPEDDEDASVPAGCRSAMPCYGGARATIGVGVCRQGKRMCVDGVLGNCMGDIQPRPETCANEGEDNDCNGTVDDMPERGAACSVERDCGEATLKCTADSEQLVCVPTRAPLEETCNQADDDCDGETDEDFDLQADTAHCGACDTACSETQACCGGACQERAGDDGCGSCGDGPACESGSACCSGSCFDVQNDPQNCGRCGRVCDDDESCCGGRCVDTRNDVNHCGGCGSTCERGNLPGCCNGSCVDFVSNDNCGRCNYACGLLGGLLCACEERNGTAQCRGVILEDLCI